MITCRGAGVYFLAWAAALTTTHARAKSYSPGEVAKHGFESDCWMSIEGKVYDVTSYLTVHPAPPRILIELCGKDASEGWRTKGKKGKAHSRKASIPLKSMFKGELIGAGN